MTMDAPAQPSPQTGDGPGDDPFDLAGHRYRIEIVQFVGGG
jgi:hypothetical protein